MNQSLRRFAPHMLGILRIVTALLFIEHGTQKLLGFPVLDFSPAVGTLPWIAGLLEVVGGAMLLLGWFTRPVAFLLAGEMAFAYWMAHAPHSPFPVVNGGDAAVMFCFVFLYLVFAGPGSFSLDARRAA